MDGVLGRVEVNHIPAPQVQIRSHGRWPVSKLQPGQTIRFSSKNYGNETVMEIERVHQMDKLVVVEGRISNGVAFNIGEMVELVTICGDEQEVQK